MKTLYDSEFITIKFDSNKQLLMDIWKPECEKMTSDQMRTEIEKITELIKEYSPKYILADNKKRHYLYKVEEQKWVAKTLVDAGTQVGVLKYALIIPEDFIAEISTNQIADEVVEITTEVKFFKTEEEAMDWFEF
jgi:hypothetical protein